MNIAVVINENITGLKVSMDNICGVKEVDGTEYII